MTHSSQPAVEKADEIAIRNEKDNMNVSNRFCDSGK
jgi:hypothetical protein